MQLSGNADLAAALAPGQVRRFVIVFKVDWARDGLYADTNSDLSALVVDADIDRQLTGNYPSQLEVTEGFAAARMVVNLEGNAPSGVPVWKLFSPYSALYPGTVAAINTPCYFDLVVQTAAGPVAVRQFTGYVLRGVPSRKNGSVSLTIQDASVLLQAPISLETWAVDGYSRMVLTGHNRSDSNTITLSSVMDHTLRRSGFYEGPPWHAGVLLGWTLCGSSLPEVGTIGMEDPMLTETWSQDYSTWNIPHYSPGGVPSSMYETGQYGMVFKGNIDSEPDATAVRMLYGNAHSPVRTDPLTFGSNNSNLLGISFWMKVGGQSGGIAQVIFRLEDASLDALPVQQQPAYVQLTVDFSTGVLDMYFVEHLWVESWHKRATLSAGWHFITALWEITSAALVEHLWVDGVVTAVTPVGVQGTWPPVPNSYPWRVSGTNAGQVQTWGRAQFVQVFYQANTLMAGYIAPLSAPPSPSVHLGLSTLRLLWRRRVRRQAAWDLLRELSTADMGALYITEQGVITYDNRATIKGRQDPNIVTLRFTLDQVEEVDPVTSLESVINAITFALQRKHAWTEGGAGTSAFRETTVNQFEVAASTSRTVPITLDDGVQSVRVGSVKLQPAAMGYLHNGGANAAWVAWMTYFKPETWPNGYTSYGPGTRVDPSVQPLPRAGATVAAALGFVDYVDQDASHIRIIVSAGPAGTVWFAVDDTTPFLNVGGTTIVDDNVDNQSLVDSVSVARYGLRTLPLQGGDWLQDSTTVNLLAASLLADTAQPRPFFESLETVGDPRTQLQDVARVDDPAGMGGPIFASIVGIKRHISRSDGVSDRYTLRTFGPIGGAWIMDDSVYSIMDTTTIVS